MRHHNGSFLPEISQRIPQSFRSATTWGNSLTTAATTLNFVGSGVTASGDGATKTITISGGGSGGSSTLADLTDVSVSSPQSGQILQYNGTNWTTSPVDSSKLIVLAGEGVGNLVSTTNSGKSIDRGSFSLSISFKRTFQVRVKPSFTS